MIIYFQMELEQVNKDKPSQCDRYNKDSLYSIYFLYQKPAQKLKHFHSKYQKAHKKQKKINKNKYAHQYRYQTSDYFYENIKCGQYFDCSLQDLWQQIVFDFQQQRNIKLDYNQIIFVNRSVKQSIASEDQKYQKRNIVNPTQKFHHIFQHFSINEAIIIQICPKNVCLSIIFRTQNQQNIERGQQNMDHQLAFDRKVPINSYLDHIITQQTSFYDQMCKLCSWKSIFYVNIFGEREDLEKSFINQKSRVDDFKNLTTPNQIWSKLFFGPIHFQLMNILVDFQSTIQIQFKMQKFLSPANYWNNVSDGFEKSTFVVAKSLIPNIEKITEDILDIWNKSNFRFQTSISEDENQDSQDQQTD